jgi:hypothetical protein
MDIRCQRNVESQTKNRLLPSSLLLNNVGTFVWASEGPMPSRVPRKGWAFTKG